MIALMDKSKIKYIFRVSPLAYGLWGMIGNRVQIPDGTAAVSAEAVLVDESRSLGNWEGRVRAAGGISNKRKSEDLLCVDFSEERESERVLLLCGKRLH
jgi:hypothetical protein